MRPRRVRSAGVFGGRSVPVRLVRRLGDHRRRADQIAGRSLQSSPTTAPSFSGPITQADRMRCCSMPITTLSASWATCRGRGIYDNVHERPSTRSAAARSARSTPTSRRWSAISYSRPSSAIQPPGVGEGPDREERPGRPPSALAADARLPLLAALNDWLETRLPGTVGPDAARLPTRRDRRRMGRRSRAA